MAKVQTEKVSMKEFRQAIKEELEALHAGVESKKKVTNRDADFTAKAVANVVYGFLVEGKNVGLSGLGTWELRERGSRMGRNPQTGEEIEIEARQAVGFVPSDSLKKAVK